MKLKRPAAAGEKARCAIYTRKSSEEGLEQAFNSLDAQREACAAFISRKNTKAGRCCQRSMMTAERG